MDELLHEASCMWSAQQVEWVAYADDLCIIVKDDSRVKLKALANECFRILGRWCSKYKPTISSSKTKHSLLKGSFDSERMPVIHNDGARIQDVKVYKYLDALLDNKLNFLDHIKSLKTRTVVYLMAFWCHVGSGWGIKRNVLEILFKTVCMPIIGYYSSCWIERCGHSHVMRHLSAIQRFFLLGSLRGCRLSATKALQVIAGQPPPDLIIVARAHSKSIKRNIPCVFQGFSYEGRESDCGITLDNLETAVQCEWQRRWDESTRGRLTHKIISSRKPMVQTLNVMYIHYHWVWMTKVQCISPKCGVVWVMSILRRE